jgi:hypothetical protein
MPVNPTYPGVCMEEVPSSLRTVIGGTNHSGRICRSAGPHAPVLPATT